MVINLLLGLSTIATLLYFVRSYVLMRKYKPIGVPAVGSAIPTVSVCIAARNETHALAQCLERVLKSDYQKLEVLVLDDSSTDDTSLIIKSFASAGVRFIAGESLPPGWLGKNHAYQTLINEASGDLILFLDVDTFIRRDTIARLVDMMASVRIAMVSVLPRRTDTEHASALFGTLRYHWELLLGTRRSPPAASALWIVKKEALQKDGVAMSNYGLSVRPERHLARQLHRMGSYRYFISSSELGVTYKKRLHSQWETATRLYYPMAGRNLPKATASAAFLICLLVPLAILLSWQWDETSLQWACALLILNLLAFWIMARRLNAAPILSLRSILWPLLIFQDLMLLIRSTVTYLSGSVTWKGRRVNAQPISHNSLEINE
jgi:glycosyltransferase involved in cell wall biosynthesis